MMFKEDETQYCPMCQEWAEKYEKLKQALEEIRHLAKLEVMLDKNSKAFYPTNIQRILDEINEALNE